MIQRFTGPLFADLPPCLAGIALALVHIPSTGEERSVIYVPRDKTNVSVT